MIINSHSDVLYPDSFKALATGGAIGNALFFFVSGYGISHSDMTIGFGRWIFKRIVRIYPAVWLFMLLCCLFGDFKYKPVDFIITPYWFINAIMIFYVMFYFIEKYMHKRLLHICLFSMFVFVLDLWLFNDVSSYIVESTSNKTFLHYFYYFPIMLTGAYFASVENKFTPPPPQRPYCPYYQKSKYLNVALLLTAVIIYYGLKVLSVKCSEIQVLSGLFQMFIPFLLFPIVCLFAACAMHIKVNNHVVRKLVSYISNLTLETYVVQFAIIAALARTELPGRLLLSFVVTILIASVLHTVSKQIQNPLIKSIIKQ